MKKEKKSPEIETPVPETYNKELEQVSEIVKSALTISSQAELAAAAEALKEVKKRIAFLVKFFKEPKAKAREAKDAIYKAEKDLLAPYEEFDRKIRLAMGDFASREQARIAAEIKEQQEIDALLDGMEDEIADESAKESAIEKPSEAKVEGLHFRTYYSFEIVDIKLIPKEFTKRVVDKEKIKDLVDSAHEKAEDLCPGIKVISEKVPVMR